jgi:hypothetical protein
LSDVEGKVGDPIHGKEKEEEEIVGKLFGALPIITN